MSQAKPTDRLSLALDATGTIVSCIRADQWSNRTPCPEWSVRALLNHLVVGNRITARTLRGEPPPPREESRRMYDTDQLGESPAQAYREAGAELASAFSEPSVFEGIFQAPVGKVPGAVLLNLRLTELLVHGWDLAHATGQPATFPDDLATQALAFSTGSSAPNVPRTGRPFGPIQTVADDAPTIDRLAAYLGRPVPPISPRTNMLDQADNERDSRNAEERFAALVDAFADEPGVTLPHQDGSRGFGSTALKVNRSIFAMLTRGHLIVKLPRDRVSALVEEGTGGPFDAGKGAPMKEWLTVWSDDVDTWQSLAREALSFVGRAGSADEPLRD